MYCVFGGFPGLHFADILHILELSQLGQRVVTQCLVKWSVAVLVLHIQLGLCSYQQLLKEATKTGNKTYSDATTRQVNLMSFNFCCGQCNASALLVLYSSMMHFFLSPQDGNVTISIQHYTI